MIIVKIYPEAFEAPRIYKIRQYPALIGRSLACHITLDHPEISKEHLLIKKQGTQFHIKDLDSTNLFKLDGQAIQELSLTKNTRLTLGSLTLEFILNEEPLDKTHDLDIRAFTQRGLGISLITYTGLLMTLLASEHFFHSLDELEISDSLFAGILLSGACFVFSIAIAFLNRIHSGTYRLQSIVHVIFRSVIALTILYLLDEFILFHLQWKTLQIAFLLTVIGGVSFYFLTRMLSLFYPQQQRKRNYQLSVGIIGILLASGLLLHEYYHRKDAEYRYFGFVSYPIANGSKKGLLKLEEDMKRSAERAESMREDKLIKEAKLNQNEN